MVDLTISFTDTLVVVTCWCGINHAIPRDLDGFQLRQFQNGERQTGIYCPLGHQHERSGTGAAERERQSRIRAEAKLAQERDRLQMERKQHSATKGQLTKAKKRIGKGVCPCCNRHFTNVERHMASQHPEFAS